MIVEVVSDVLHSKSIDYEFHLLFSLSICINSKIFHQNDKLMAMMSSSSQVTTFV